MRDRIVFHIDANSAYLSWEAAYRLSHGETIDLREVPAIVGGDPVKRSGIVLAKSIPAKKLGIATGEVLWKALQKCPNLKIIKPNYSLYMKCSKAMNEIISEYAPQVQRFSIDESFAEFTGTNKLWGDPVQLAYTIKNRIRDELGFTVNIGVSSNKLLAKMAGELRKPDMVHTLFPEELEEKFWPLPIGELYGIGRATTPKLQRQGIMTIGDLARMDSEFLQYKLGKYGLVIWKYANGIEDSMTREATDGIKGIGNSSTLKKDLDDRETAHLFLLSLTEMVSMRLRDSGNMCGLVSVSIKYTDLGKVSHQRKLFYSTDNTNEIFNEVRRLFDESWNNEAIRHLGVRVSHLSSSDDYQLPILDTEKFEKNRNLDSTIDDLRLRFGKNSIIRSSFLHTPIKPVTGGVGEDDYLMMGSIL